MKKTLLITAIASMSLVSCVNDEVVNPSNPSNQKIMFDSPVMYSNETTRANVYGEIGAHTEGILSYTYPKAENFVIYAISHEGDFAGWANGTAAAFNGTAISYESSIDGWAPKTSDGKYYYWENGKKMSFAASSPADLEQTWGDANRSYGPTGLIIKDFEVSADPAKQFDLLFSTRVCNQTSANMLHEASYYSGIPIKFQHALSSIRFSVGNSAYSTETVVLTGIELNGVKYKGTFNENIVEQATDYALYDREENVTPAWTVADNIISNPYVAFAGTAVFPESAKYVSQIVAEDESNTSTVNQLLLMPQELTDDVILTVHYTVNGSANTKTIPLKGLISGPNADDPKVPITAWEMGKRYIYRLHYSAETAAKDKIYFSPSTEEWEDVKVIVVEL